MVPFRGTAHGIRPFLSVPGNILARAKQLARIGPENYDLWPNGRASECTGILAGPGLSFDLSCVFYVCWDWCALLSGELPACPTV
jgi:hypothetical protein